MAFITADQARTAAESLRQKTRKTEGEILRDSRDTSRDSFDIFLSHSSQDKELVVGAKHIIEQHGFSVYVDWIDDAQRNVVVDRRLAERLRVRMRQCESLFYLHTPSASLSKWCPWELGFFDGLKTPEKRVFIFPVIDHGQSYKGQEYLDLYDTVDLAVWSRPPRRRTSNSGDVTAARLLADHFGIIGRPRIF